MAEARAGMEHLKTRVGKFLKNLNGGGARARYDESTSGK